MNRHHGAIGNAAYLAAPLTPRLTRAARFCAARPGRLSACSDDVSAPAPRQARGRPGQREAAQTSPSGRTARAVPRPSAARSNGAGGSPTSAADRQQGCGRAAARARPRGPDAPDGGACSAARSGRCRARTAVPCAPSPATTSTPGADRQRVHPVRWLFAAHPAAVPARAAKNPPDRAVLEVVHRAAPDRAEGWFHGSEDAAPGRRALPRREHAGHRLVRRQARASGCGARGYRRPGWHRGDAI